MKNVLILHGTNSDSQGNWFPWLKQELKKRGYKVWVPDLPNSNVPNIQSYLEFIFSKWQFDSKSLIIGHSSGAAAILGILQKLPENIVINKAILVAGFTDNLGRDDLNEIFLNKIDYQKIKRSSKKFILIHSDDDPYVSLDYGKLLKEKLDGELVLIPRQKHFSISTAGQKYKQFPEILKYIKRG